jgi:hypothetical protein
MVPMMSLLVPILVAAVVVFFVSWAIHMMLKYHKSDFLQVPSEDAVMDALRPFNIPPGDYGLPNAGDMETFKDPAFQEKMNKGPVVFMTVLPNGQFKMGASLVQWFIYCIVVGLFAAYIAGRALGPGADYLSVFRFAGATSFIGYALALVQNSIWTKKAWSSTLKSVFDGLVYALLTAGVFGWLWPAA